MATEYPIILWLNLDRNESKRKRMELLLTERHINNTRISAVDPNDQYLLASTYNCDPKMTLIENASMISNLKAIKHFLDICESDVAIISDDDLSFEFEKYWKGEFGNIISSAPKDWDIIQLSLILPEISSFFNLFQGEDQWIEKGLFFAGKCYLINKKAAKKILDSFSLQNKTVSLNISVENQAISEQTLEKIAKVYTYYQPLFSYEQNNINIIYPWQVSCIIPSIEFFKSKWECKITKDSPHNL